jgi:endo-1,4-beta-mannosidase
MYAKIGMVKLVCLMLALSFPHIVLSDELQKGYRSLHNSTIPFLNGINAPWKAFGTDVGKHPNWGVLHDIHFFDSLFTEVAKAGGNSVRWWVHCDGRSTPEFDNSGMVTGLDPEFFVHFDAILNSAAQRGILLMPVLWSFDMANDNTGGAGPYGGKHITLITDSACTRSYIDNCLIPLVKRYEKHPALLAWEICNEPEWMLDSDGSTLQRTNAKQLQTWIGRLASAIRKQNPAALVTVGSGRFLE